MDGFCKLFGVSTTQVLFDWVRENDYSCWVFGLMNGSYILSPGYTDMSCSCGGC